MAIPPSVILLVVCVMFPLNLLAQDNPLVLPTTTAEWMPRMTWSGDIRYRLARNKEDKDEERKFQQLRARLGIKADVNKDVQAIIRLATATSAISTNQTMGDSNDPGMTRRSFGLDLSYIDWAFWEHGRVWLGRTANPFWSPAKAQTIFDADLAFEGLAIKLEPKNDTFGGFLNLGGFIISENYAAPDDSVDTALVGGDIGASWKGGSWSLLTVHLGNYHFLNVQNKDIKRLDKDAKIDPYFDRPGEIYKRYRGNTVYVVDPQALPKDRVYRFAGEYVLYEAGLEWKQKFGKFEGTLFGEFVHNDRRTDQNQAKEYGVGAKWDWVSVGYAQVIKETDSVLGAFTDSDANGGGSDTSGERWAIAFQIGKNAAAQVTHFNARRGVDSFNRNFSMTHVDFAVNF